MIRPKLKFHAKMFASAGLSGKGGKDMFKWLLWLVAALVIIIGITAYFFFKGPDVSRYLYLKEPRISEKPDQPMLVVEAKGDPNVIGGKVFSLLFKTYYALKDNAKSFAVAPRARWPIAVTLPPKDQWQGSYALPVSSTAKFPDKFKVDDPSLKVALVTWSYGTVAEILHIGPYSAEAPAIKKLQDFVKASGYRVIGEHEEEYVKGPSMFGPGDPKGYYTIIRYQVVK
jgi:hypothetical protein